MGVQSNATPAGTTEMAAMTLSIQVCTQRAIFLGNAIAGGSCALSSHPDLRIVTREDLGGDQWTLAGFPDDQIEVARHRAEE